MNDLLKEQYDAFKEMKEWTKRQAVCLGAILFGFIAFIINVKFLNGSAYLLVTIILFFLVFWGIGYHAGIQATKQGHRFWKARNEYKIKKEEGSE